MSEPSGVTYEGEWYHNKRQGHGIQTWPDGKKYEGAWKQGKKHGFGTMTYSDGTKENIEFYEDEIREDDTDDSLASNEEDAT